MTTTPLPLCRYDLTQRKQGTKTGELEGVQIIEDVQMPDFVVMQARAPTGNDSNLTRNDCVRRRRDGGARSYG